MLSKCKNVKVTKIHWLIREANGEKTLLSEKLQEKCIREFKHGCSNVLTITKSGKVRDRLLFLKTWCTK